MIQNLLSVNFLAPFVAHKIDFSKSYRGVLRGMPRRLLLVGHKLDSDATTLVTLPEAPWVIEVPSSASPGSMSVGEIVQVSTEADAITMAGEGSMLVAMWRAAKANAAPGLQIDMVALDPAASAGVASSTIVVATSGPSAEATGEVMVYIGGVRIGVGVTTADTASTIATKLIDAINAKPELPVAASAVANPAHLRLTCRWPGLTGNMIDLRSSLYASDLLPAGVTLTIPAMSGGTLAPDIDDLVTAMASYRATEIVFPFTDAVSMNTLEVELATRWGFANMQDGQVVTAVRGSQSTVSTWLDDRNSEQGHTIVTTNDCSNPWETAAMAGAQCEVAATIDPLVPHTGIKLVGYVGAKRGQHWDGEQINDLLLQGGSPLDADGNLLRMVTNYKKATTGTYDPRKRELCWIKFMSYYRWLTTSEFRLNYQGFKLAEYVTEPIPGQKIMTAELGEEVMLGQYQQLMNAGLVQNMDYYKSTLLVEVDGPNGRLKIQDEPVMLSQHYQTEITSYPIAGHVA